MTEKEKMLAGILYDANNDKNLKFEILEAGADDFLNKPFVTEELVARLRSASRYVRLQERLKEENKLLHDLANELEDSIADLRGLAYNLMHARIPNSIIKMQKVGEISTWMAKQFNEFDDTQISDIEIAAREIIKTKKELYTIISKHSGQTIEKVAEDVLRTSAGLFSSSLNASTKHLINIPTSFLSWPRFPFSQWPTKR